MLSPGDKAPAIELLDQNGAVVQRSGKSRNLLIFFYPKASAPGCTQQACLLRDLVEQVGDTAIVGISPDKSSAQNKFDVARKISHAWYKISPKDTPVRLLEALAG